MTDDATEWMHLSPRVAIVHIARLVLTLLPIAAAFAIFGQIPGGGLLFGIFAAMVVGVVLDFARLIVTRYRVGDERVEVREGLITRRTLFVPRQRVRSVDITAKPLHRLAGLAVVRIGTGEQANPGSAADLILDALDRDTATRLRTMLLDHSVAEGEAPALENADASEQAQVAASEPPPISQLQWRWLPWSIVSWWTLALPGAVFGFGYQLLSDSGYDPLEGDVTQERVDGLLSLDPVLLAAMAIPVYLAIGVIARVATFIETWWGFQLSREGDGTIRTQRGLLTSRSTSLQEARIRGVQITEPLLLRPFNVAEASVVTTGLAQAGGGPTGAGSTSLGPHARRHETEAVVADVLKTGESPTASGQLIPHPRAALQRRLVRAGLGSGLLWVVLAALMLIEWPSGAAVAGAVVLTAGASIVAVVYAIDTWRSLGHALHGSYLLLRRGSMARRTVALEREGVVGWVGSSTLFQRRSGLMSLTATTAAGSGAYSAIDIGVDRGVALADAATPGLLAPFLSVTSGEPQR